MKKTAASFKKIFAKDRKLYIIKAADLYKLTLRAADLNKLDARLG